MSKQIFLEQALVLPASDIAAMLRGQLIVAIPQVQIAKGLSFLLSPEVPASEVDLSKRYRATFLTLAETVLHQNEDIQVEAWATCEQTKMIHDIDQISTISSLTIWDESYLAELLTQRQYLFLSYLKVYRLYSSFVLPKDKFPNGKLGKFVGLSVMDCQPVKVSESFPILSDRLFLQRKQQLENAETSKHSDLEVLQSAIAHYSQVNPEAKTFENELRVFLGWADHQDMIFPTNKSTSIIDAGNSSDGDLFEKLVRQGFVDLGFTNTLNNIKAALNPHTAGGAGGIDIYCEKPFPIVGECKASQSEKVPGGVAAQLITLGTNHLSKDQFSASVKIVFAGGKLTTFDENAVNEHEMNVMRPDTLQRLVNLKSAHPGAIDLLELEPCLRREPFGTESDKKVNEFIDQIEKRIEIRSHIVCTIKNYLQEKDLKVINFERFCGILDASKPPQDLTDRELHDTLIELSSPLTGYLGRTKGTTWKDDRFYFLRDLIV